MSKPVIHQVLIGASDGDAITQMALAVRDALRPHAESEIYAWWRLSDRMREECLDLSYYPDSDNVDLLLYHSSIGLAEMTDFLRQRTEKLAISYHNITPSEMYEEFNPDFAEDLARGRNDLNELLSKVSLTIADSQFNARDIERHGYSNVHVIPAGFTPSRLAEEEYDAVVLNEMARRYPNGYIVAVGQILPHKRIEQLMETVHLLNSTYWSNVGLVVCGVARQQGYWNAVNKFRSKCAMVDVHFTGPVSDTQLSSYVRGARAYLGMSDHEGLSIPPIEAMYMGVPVVVKGAAAVPETVGDAALVLSSDAGPLIAAEALYEVLTNDELRWGLIHKGINRATELEMRMPSATTAELLLGAVR